MELSTHSTATPESANTASHMDAKPKSPSAITAAFTSSAKITFCQAMVRVFRASSTDSGKTENKKHPADRFRRVLLMKREGCHH